MLEDLLSPRPTQPAAGGKVLVNWGRGEGWAVLFASCGGGNLGIFDGAGKVAGGGVWCAGYAVLLRPKCKWRSAGSSDDTEFTRLNRSGPRSLRPSSVFPVGLSRGGQRGVVKRRSLV
jgi:hypothetical protein